MRYTAELLCQTYSYYQHRLEKKTQANFLELLLPSYIQYFSSAETSRIFSGRRPFQKTFFCHYNQMEYSSPRCPSLLYEDAYSFLDSISKNPKTRQDFATILIDFAKRLPKEDYDEMRENNIIRDDGYNHETLTTLLATLVWYSACVDRYT